LSKAAAFWWFTAILGQWAFLYYIVAFYGASTLTGNFGAWSKNTFLFKGYVPGDTTGNLAFAAHVLLAAVIALGGTVQLIPSIRQHAIFLHRWNGRLFMVTALGVSASGLYMVWVRHSNALMAGAFATSLNAVLIITFAVSAWRAALARDIASHRRWALRLFLAANGQWFIRVGVFTWIILNGAAGLPKNFGPFIFFWNFGCYLVPLAVLELYLRAKLSVSPRVRYAMAASLFALTILMSIGVFGVSMFVWRPLVAKI